VIVELLMARAVQRTKNAIGGSGDSVEWVVSIADPAKGQPPSTLDPAARLNALKGQRGGVAATDGGGSGGSDSESVVRRRIKAGAGV